jgi:hypothetical protein
VLAAVATSSQVKEGSLLIEPVQQSLRLMSRELHRRAVGSQMQSAAWLSLFFLQKRPTLSADLPVSAKQLIAAQARIAD